MRHNNNPFRKAMQEHNVTLGRKMSDNGHIYEVTAVNGKKRYDLCVKIFVGCPQSDVISEYLIGKQCHAKDERHFIRYYDLIPFTVRDNTFDYDRNCWAMFMQKAIPFTFAPGPKSSAFYVKFIKELTLALQTMHQENVVHFDIKPDNIVINNDTYALLDFGISKRIGDATINFYDISSTRYYAPPEIFQGELSKKADLYSLGMTIRYVLMNGIHEFETNGISIPKLCQMKKYLEPLRSDDEYVQHFLDIINKMTEYYPCNRYDSTEAVLDDLNRFPVKEDIRFYSMCYCSEST